MDRLPDELLLFIFSEWITSWNKESVTRRPPYILFDVCQRWRRLAFDQTLWRDRTPIPMTLDALMFWVTYDAESVSHWSVGLTLDQREVSEVLHHCPHVLSKITLLHLTNTCTHADLMALGKWVTPKLTTLQLYSYDQPPLVVPVLPKAFASLASLHIGDIRYGMDRESDVTHHMTLFIETMPNLVDLEVPNLHHMPIHPTLKRVETEGLTGVLPETIHELVIDPTPVTLDWCRRIQLPELRLLSIVGRLQDFAELKPLPHLEHVDLDILDECENEDYDYRRASNWLAFLPRHVSFLFLRFQRPGQLDVATLLKEMVQKVSFDEMIIQCETEHDFEKLNDHVIEPTFRGFLRSLTRKTVEPMINGRSLRVYGSSMK